MKKIKNYFFISLQLILSGVFIYAFIVKIQDYDLWIKKWKIIDCVNAIHLSKFGFFIPASEISTSILMFFGGKYKIVGLWLSLLMLMTYTIYLFYNVYIWEISLCPCGGIFSFLMLDKQFYLTFLLLLAAILIIVKYYWQKY